VCMVRCTSAARYVGFFCVVRIVRVVRRMRLVRCVRVVTLECDVCVVCVVCDMHEKLVFARSCLW